MHILGSLFVFKLAKNIIANFLYAFSQQFMKSIMSCWNMFGKILVFCFLSNDVLKIRQLLLPSTVLFR